MRSDVMGFPIRRTRQPGKQRPSIVSVAMTSGGRAVVVLMAAMALLPGAALGAGWAIQPTALPAGINDGSLSGVSCVSSALCIAVGGASDVDASGNPIDASVLIEMWNGIGWMVMPAPGPASQRPALAGVSCISATDCVAVGSVASLSGAQTRPLAEIWNGNSWNVQPVPDVGARYGAELNAVSCTSAADCVAVGTASYSSPPPGAPEIVQALVERWNGTDWQVQQTPTLAPHVGVSLSSVSCVAASACTAVGGIERAVPSANSTPLAEDWDGRRWSFQSVPHPAAALLQGVSCTARANCIAVGGNIDDQTATAPAVAEHWNGKAWSSAHFPAIPRVIGNLYGVSCASPSGCTAVGTLGPGVLPTRFKRELLTDRWNGRSWVAGQASEPHGGFASLTGVSCNATTDCVAVGQHSQGDRESALAERERT